jgi:hypothetical protein
MTDTRYNGWSSYQTWVVNLWMGESGTFFDEMAEEFDSPYDFAQWLKEYHEEFSPIPSDEASVYSDLMGWSLSAVNWDEIAHHYFDDRE